MTDYEEVVQECKGVLKHAWYTSTTNRKPKAGVYIANRCERCGNERVMAVMPGSGRALTPWRYLPADPVAYKAIKADSMDEWRAMYLKKHGIKARKR